MGGKSRRQVSGSRGEGGRRKELQGRVLSGVICGASPVRQRAGWTHGDSCARLECGAGRLRSGRRKGAKGREEPRAGISRNRAAAPSGPIPRSQPGRPALRGGSARGRGGCKRCLVCTRCIVTLDATVDLVRSGGGTCQPGAWSHPLGTSQQLLSIRPLIALCLTPSSYLGVDSVLQGSGDPPGPGCQLRGDVCGQQVRRQQGRGSRSWSRVGHESSGPCRAAELNAGPCSLPPTPHPRLICVSKEDANVQVPSGSQTLSCVSPTPAW